MRAGVRSVEESSAAVVSDVSDADAANDEVDEAEFLIVALPLSSCDSLSSRRRLPAVQGQSRVCCVCATSLHFTATCAAAPHRPV